MTILGALRVSVLCCTLALAGCTSVNRFSQEDKFNPGVDSAVVLGLRPENHRVQIFPGSIKDGRWRERLLGVAAFFGSAENGYVLAKVPSDTPLAIAMVSVVANKSDILGVQYTPCGDSETVVFQAPKGKVIYLGDFFYRSAGSRLQLEYAADFDRARNHVDENFPVLFGLLEKGKFDLMPTALSCAPGTIYIPIFLPGK